ncbi:bifunctional (p)ppGpp synthetase/guanosine-3',5'-bis(diphosphate) 3'-pyrophosphohydrolase [bacterium]|nr:bifunctional (p)ppGpp synthetase/guanosine-3',5'-bis(diphosphate) 3'-pyrophosphohydrolase [bacterium]
MPQTATLPIKLDDIVSKVRQYNDRANIDIINKAYVFTAKAHEGQMRKSGHPYVIHPLEVANILADMKLDVSSVAAGILHDTLEDTEASKEQIESIFGRDIAELVDGVTKLSKLNFNTKEDRQAENFRKMIIAMSKDIRVILIKLADRLNNLRTLQFMPEEKQMRIAKETLDIYAPIASRLGIDWLKVELEDLSFRFYQPDSYKQIEKKMARLKSNREEYIARVVKEIRDKFEGDISGIEIVGRMKNIYSIYCKMERQKITFEQIHDLLAFRIITRSLEECYEVLGQLHSLWKPVPGRFKDYIAMPKSNNYQSLHTTVICLDGERVEFQIRTQTMHEIANKGIAAHWKYKDDGKLDTDSEATFQWLRQLMEWQKELKDSIEFLDTVKLDLYTSDIYVFTPRGDVRSLPHSSTPIDFAYSIHTDIGNHCTGAKVNGRMVPLSHKLESGDEVEIITNPKKGPTKDWLKLVASSSAKAHIRQHLKQEQRKKSLEIGKNIFEDECEKMGIKPDDVFKAHHYGDYTQKKGINNELSLYSAVAYGKIAVSSMLEELFPNKKPEGEKPPEEKEGIIQRIFDKVSQRNKNVVLIDGMDNILVTFAKCCYPLPGDPIVGIISRGRGLKIHRTDCSRILTYDTERRIQADWNKGSAFTRSAKVRIVSENKTGMLALVAQNIAERKLDITKAVVRTTRDLKAIIMVEIVVPNVLELSKVVKSLQRIEGVISVERVYTKI